MMKNCSFDAMAERYDDWYKSAAGLICDRFEKKAFDCLLKTYHGSKKLLEVGCGTGHWSQYFSKHGFEVTGIDVSEKMLKIARHKNIPRCHFYLGDGQDLSFSNHSFDAAAAITSLEFSKDPEKFVSEMARSVKCGGKLWLGVLNSLSPYNRKRNSGIYRCAKMFSPGQLKELLDLYGRVKIKTAVFILDRPLWVKAASFFELLGQCFFRKKGAFILAEVQL